MSEYDFFIAGRFRNKDNIKKVLEAVVANGKTAYCFIDNDYKNESIALEMQGDPEQSMLRLESLSQDDPLIRKIFETDITAEREAQNFLLVLPAGIAGHIEAGAAYGMGKKCYAVGQLEKTETLYCIFDKIFPDLDALKSWLSKN